MSDEERKLKAKVDEYFEKYICVSFDKFIENWEDLERYSKEQDKILQQKGQLQEDLDMLGNRIDKAIEYIKERFDEDKGIWIIDCYDLLEILQGSDEE